MPILSLLPDFLDPEHLISTFGQIGVIAIIFTESFFAFFLPGDSLLFTTGLFAAQDKFGLNIWVLTIGTTIGAIAGNQLGYYFGRKAGPALFRRPDSRLFKQEYLEKTHHYFERFGPKTIFIARFIPVVRTFACVVAGAGNMQYRVFLTYNVLGGIAWAAGVTLLGYGLGSALPDNFNIDKYLLPLVAIIILISVLPAIIEYMRAKKHRAVVPSAQTAERLADVTGRPDKPRVQQ